MKTQTLSIDLLRIDGGTQSRVSINEDTVSEYTDLIIDSGSEWPFPPLDVFHDGTDYFVADGFHRVLAAQRAKRGSIPCNVHKGTADDAHIFGMTANDKHGLRMTRADKRKCVEWLLDRPGKLTQAKVAELAGVSIRTVKDAVSKRTPTSVAGKKNPPQRTKEGQIAPQQPESGENAPIPEKSQTEGYIDVIRGQEGRTDSDGTDSKESAPRPSRSGTDKPGASSDLGKCPACLGTKWKDGKCAKCGHIHGESVGEVEGDRINTQRSKTVKTCEALQREIDDLNLLVPRKDHSGVTNWKADEVDSTIRDMGIVAAVKGILRIAKAWK